MHLYTMVVYLIVWGQILVLWDRLTVKYRIEYTDIYLLKKPKAFLKRFVFLYLLSIHVFSSTTL